MADTQWSPGPLEIDGLDSLWKLRKFQWKLLGLDRFENRINNWRMILTVYISLFTFPHSLNINNENELDLEIYKYPVSHLRFVS